MLFRTAGLIATQRDSDVPLTSTRVKAASTEGGGREGWRGEGGHGARGKGGQSDGSDTTLNNMTAPLREKNDFPQGRRGGRRWR